MATQPIDLTYSPTFSISPERTHVRLAVIAGDAVRAANDAVGALPAGTSDLTLDQLAVRKADDPIAAASPDDAPDFATAKAEYLAAKRISKAYDEENGLIIDLPAGPARDAAIAAISKDVWTEAMRLDDIWFAAEDVLMAIPSPDVVAFAFKVLVAHAERGVACADDRMLQIEAKRFVGDDAEVWRSQDDEPYRTAEQAVQAQLAAGAQLIVEPDGNLDVGASFAFHEAGSSSDRWAAMRVAHMRYEATLRMVPGARETIVDLIRRQGVRCDNGCYFLKQGAQASAVAA